MLVKCSITELQVPEIRKDSDSHGSYPERLARRLSLPPHPKSSNSKQNQEDASH